MRVSGSRFALLLSAVGVVAFLPACQKTPRVGTSTPRSSENPDEAEIYAAVIRRLYLVDSSFGDSPSFSKIFVRSWVGMDKQDESEPGRSFGAETTERIRQELSDLPPLEFVDDPQDVIGSDARGSVVRDNGVLVRLGEIVRAGEKVEVSAGLYHSNLGASGLTYVLAHRPTGWEVEGDTGVRWVS